MPLTPDPSVLHATVADANGEFAKRLKFGKDNDFQIELRRRVEAVMKAKGLRPRDCPAMYLKTAIILTVFASSYALLVFAATAWWQVVPLAVLLGLATAAIGFNVQHDGGHRAFSDRPWVNKLMAATLDLIGGSSYMWNWKHAVFHHTYTNISGHDFDIDVGGVGRLSPNDAHHPLHRWQHVYLWPLYGVLALRWHFFADFDEAIRGRMGHHRIQRPQGWDLVQFIAAKVTFFALAFGIPLLFHPFWAVALTYGLTAVVLGTTLGIVFQLAHAVDAADFPVPQEGSGTIESAWAIHQVETTVDFARGSRVAAWLFGGLNYQIEHHLFPRVCHVNYPAISQVVEQTCREYGVRYVDHGSFIDGVKSHYRWLRELGRAA